MPQHHPGAFAGSLACSPPGADFIFVLAPSRRTGAPAERRRVVPDSLTSHRPERDMGGWGWGVGPTCDYLEFNLEAYILHGVQLLSDPCF